MKIIDFLKSHENLEIALAALNAETGIVARDYPDYFVLNYSQIDSPKTHPLVVEARSLILKKDLTVASRSFDRFFNFGEALEHYANFDWNNAIVFEKVDGSLIKVWHDDVAGIWQIATRSSAMAEVPHPMGGTFREWVLKAFNVSEERFQEVMAPINTGDTYIFEYIGTENRIVTRYEKSQMVLLAIRNKNGMFYPQRDITFVSEMMAQTGFNVREVKTYAAASIHDLENMARELPALDEGYVVWDFVHDLRIKIKNPVYCRLHSMRGNEVSIKKFWELVLEGEDSEFLTYFPEYTNIVEPMIKEINTIKNKMNAVFEEHKFKENQKDFALSVKDYPYSAILFSARKTGKPITQVFEEARMEWKVDLLMGEE